MGPAVVSLTHKLLLLLLPASSYLPGGNSLRKLLSSKLGCSPKRVSKKFEGTDYCGKSQYKTKPEVSKELIEETKEMLLDLEQRFLEATSGLPARTRVPPATTTFSIRGLARVGAACRFTSPGSTSMGLLQTWSSNERGGGEMNSPRKMAVLAALSAPPAAASLPQLSSSAAMILAQRGELMMTNFQRNSALSSNLSSSPPGWALAGVPPPFGGAALEHPRTYATSPYYSMMPSSLRQGLTSCTLDAERLLALLRGPPAGGSTSIPVQQPSLHPSTSSIIVGGNHHPKRSAGSQETGTGATASKRARIV